jgi:hypothetical protein
MMNTRIFLLACILLVAVGSARAQGGVEGYPFDTPADPRSMGMGESFVAVPSSPSALMYNPSGLAGLQGISLSYSRRALNAVSVIDESMCYSLTGTVAVPFGVFAVQYNRKLYGTFLVTTSTNPDGLGTELTLYSYDVAVGFGTRLRNGPALGVAVKYYDFVGGFSEPAYLFDFGLLYTLPPMHDQSSICDSLSVGISVQNIWTQKSATVGGLQIVENIPEYFRIGIAYALSVVPREGSRLSPVAFVVTGEYRNLLSQHVILNEGRAFWGVGFETTVFEILSLRAGAYMEPFNGFDGEMDRPAFRYGAGVNLPLRKFGSGIPLLVSFNYAVEPLNQIVNPYLAGFTERSSLAAFSLDLHYEANLW